MLTPADCDYRQDLGEGATLLARVVWRLSPDCHVDSFREQLMVCQEDLYAAQFYAGCHNT